MAILPMFRNVAGLIIMFFLACALYAVSQNSMDRLEYIYAGGSNRLRYITDVVPAAASTVDLDNQPSGNYSYDAGGRLIRDRSEGILSMAWTVSGKVKQVQLDDDADHAADRTLSFSYDALGNRVKKTETILAGGETTTTCYARKVTGEVMVLYCDTGTGLQRTEVITDVGIDKAKITSSKGNVYSRSMGQKNYELKVIIIIL
jgi:YD repeat-containing protein